MAVLENITISCFLENKGNIEELPPILEGGFGILTGEQQLLKGSDIYRSICSTEVYKINRRKEKKNFAQDEGNEILAGVLTSGSSELDVVTPKPPSLLHAIQAATLTISRPVDRARISDQISN
jgi:hypothetical protein